MNFSNYKLMALFLLLMSFTISWITTNWMILWIMLEINTLSFIYISYNMSNFSLNSNMKYFIMQAIPSSMFILLLSMNEIINNNYHVNILLPLIFVFKLGFFPFHNWIISISESLNWNNFILLNTIQKIIPLFIMSTMITNSWNYCMVITLFTAFMASNMMYYSSSIKKLLVLSSLIHMSWMLFMIYNQSMLWLLYMMMYFLCSFLLFFLPSFILNYNQLFLYKKNMIMFTILMNFCSLPPTVFFLSKMKALESIIMYNSSNIMSLMLLIIASLISCYMYLYMSYPIFLKNINTLYNYNTKLLFNIIMFMSGLIFLSFFF